MGLYCETTTYFTKHLKLGRFIISHFYVWQLNSITTLSCVTRTHVQYIKLYWHPTYNCEKYFDIFNNVCCFRNRSSQVHSDWWPVITSLWQWHILFLTAREPYGVHIKIWTTCSTVTKIWSMDYLLCLTMPICSIGYIYYKLPTLKGFFICKNKERDSNGRK